MWWSPLFSHPLALLDIKDAIRLNNKGMIALNNLWDGPFLGWRDELQLKMMF